MPTPHNKKQIDSAPDGFYSSTLTPLEVATYIKTYHKLPKLARLNPDFLWKEFLVNQTEYPNLTQLYQIKRTADLLSEYKRVYLDSKPITITSGWRSIKYNALVGGAKNSYHLKGMAADFVVKDLSPQSVQKRLDIIHKGGMEYAPTWTHIDTRPYRARFSVT